MSKLSQLKQEAYLAAKKRNWEQAVSVYQRILELDKNNPTVINEFGDVCLKGGDTQAAIRHFLNAASKYRGTGLLNNAVAIYKKILRYDAENLNAHWYLAETRAHQGLTVEGENHGLHFLDNSASVTGDIKEIFLKRCNQLFELYPSSDPILERLVQIFRMWKMPLEAARAVCLLACRQFDAGEHDEAKAMVNQALAQAPEVRNYPEHAQWQRRHQPDGAAPAAFSTFGQVSLDGPAASGGAAAPTNPRAFGEVELGASGAADAPAVVQVQDAPAPEVEAEVPAEAATAPAAAGRSALDAIWDAVQAGSGQDGADDDPAGAIAIDSEGADFDSLIAEATAQITSRRPAPDAQSAAGDEDEACDPAAAAAESAEDAGEKAIDLLAEILADDTSLLAGGDTAQLESITREIGTQVGGDESDQDPASLYEMGTVYLEMGMHLQACESFAKATGTDDVATAMKAYEMWGLTLERSGRLDEAIEVLRRGLKQAEKHGQDILGLLYNLGKACETGERTDEAVAAYERIAAAAPNYQDVGRRLARLTTV